MLIEFDSRLGDWYNGDMLLASSICRYCEQEFFYPPVAHGRMMGANNRPIKGRVRKRKVCDLCRDDEKRVRRIKKFGAQAADDVPKTMQEQGREDYVWGCSSLQVIQSSPHIDHPLGHLSADRECEHGRLPGDTCPSPRIVMTSDLFKGTVIQNWPHEAPCPCWGE